MAVWLLATAAAGQSKNGAGYDCDEEIFPRYDKATRTYGYVNIVGQWRVEPTFTKAERFNGKLAVVQRGAKYGLVNCQGFLVASTVYDDIQNLANGRAWMRQGNLWGLLDDKGKVVVPPAFEEIRPVAPRNELTWVKKRNQWGIFSKDRLKMLVEPRFEGCRSISDSLGLGLKEGLVYPIYLGTGQVIYDSCSQFTLARGNAYLFAYRKKIGLMEATGSVLLRPDYDSLLANDNYLLAYQKGKGAIASYNGKLTTPLAYDALLGSDGMLIAARQGEKWGYLLPSGKVFVPINYAQALPQQAGYYALQQADGMRRWALGNAREAMPLRFDYRQVSFNLRGLGAIVTVGADSLQAFSFKAGALLPEVFRSYAQAADSAQFLYTYQTAAPPADPASAPHGLLHLTAPGKRIALATGQNPVHLGGPWFQISGPGGLGLYNIAAGRVVVEPRYTSVGLLEGSNNQLQGYDGKSVQVFGPGGKPLFAAPAEALALVQSNKYVFKQGGAYGLIALPEGEVVLKAQYASLQPAGGFAGQERTPLIGYRKGKARLLSLDGKELSDGVDSIRYVGQQKFAFLDKGSYYLADRTGKRLSDAAYLAIDQFADDLLLVRAADGTLAYLNKQGAVAFGLPKATEAGRFNKGVARVRWDNKAGLVNKQGKLVQILP